MDISGVNAVPQTIETQKVGGDTRINQSPKVDLNDPVDTLELSSKESGTVKSSKAKKIGTGLASALYPGLGQLINGEAKKGAKFFFGQFALDMAAGLGAAALATAGSPVSLVIGGIGILAHAGIGIASIVDAVKNA